MGAIDPLTRKEQYLAYAGGGNVSKPETPLTREEEYLNDICERLGVRHLIATDFDIETGEIHTPCFRERKVDLFRAAFPGQGIDDFYTDSVNDSFLFPLAKRVFMVRGKKIEQIK